MRSSEDLLKVVTAMFREIIALDLKPLACSFHFVDEEADRITTYGVYENPRKYGISLSSLMQALPGVYEIDEDILGFEGEQTISQFLSAISPTAPDYVERWRAGKVWSHREIASETRHIKEKLEVYPEWRNLSFFTEDGIVTHVSFPYGTVAIKQEASEHAEEHIVVVQTLTEALSLGYLRFLDFQQLEEQAESLKEQAEKARRERAVGRVRAETLSMRKSDDLLKVVEVILQELINLGMDTKSCFINFVDAERQLVRAYQAYINLKKTGISWTSADLAGINEDVVAISSEVPYEYLTEGWVENWSRQKMWTTEYTAEDIENYSKTIFIDVPFAHGTIGVPVPQFSEEYADIIRAFTEALSLGYRRFLDFQQLEEQNIQIQEANRLKSDFLARMSHDLRTPMNAIIGYTRILLRQAKDVLNERQYHNLDNIQISAHNLLNLINDILDLSKIEANRIDIEPEQVDLKQLASECVVSVESLLKPEVTLEQHIEKVDPIRTDLDRLRRVVMNLLSNALKFTDEGRITLSLRAVDEWLELSVADTGMGIPPEDLPHIFDEFRQVESERGKTQEGTGLGLSIARKSIEMLGGTISAESEVGKGTKFTLRIKDYTEKEAE